MSRATKLLFLIGEKKKSFREGDTFTLKDGTLKGFYKRWVGDSESEYREAIISAITAKRGVEKDIPAGNYEIVLVQYGWALISLEGSAKHFYVVRFNNR